MLRHTEDWEVIQDSQQIFTKEMFCLLSLVTFCSGMAPSTDKERDIQVICMDFCKALDMVPTTYFLLRWRGRDLMAGVASE